MFDRLWGWLTEEVPTQAAGRRIAARGPGSGRSVGAGPGLGAPRRRRTARRASPAPTRAGAWNEAPPWGTMGAIALVAGAAIVAVALHAPAGPRTVATSRPAGAAALVVTSATTKTRPAAGRVVPTVPGSAGAPDCTSMRMQPVTPQNIRGLCVSIGGAYSWRVGCAPGFQASCDPALQRVLACVRQVGARAAVSAQGVSDCATRVAGELAASGGVP